MLKFVLAAALAATASLAHAHDDWMGVYERNDAATGRLCCGGSDDMNDPSSDCEHLTDSQLQYTADGVWILSRRYHAKVFVPNVKIHWDYPRNATTKEVTPMSPAYPAGWCGKPRGTTWNSPSHFGPDNPDPNFYTFCAFVLPGGT
jgi:hypothetical protein